jgi:hypothetical protein
VAVQVTRDRRLDQLRHGHRAPPRPDDRPGGLLAGEAPEARRDPPSVGGDPVEQLGDRQEPVARDQPQAGVVFRGPAERERLVRGRCGERPLDLARPEPERLVDVREELGRAPHGLGLGPEDLGQGPRPGGIDRRLEVEEGPQARLEPVSLVGGFHRAPPCRGRPGPPRKCATGDVRRSDAAPGPGRRTVPERAPGPAQAPKSSRQPSSPSISTGGRDCPLQPSSVRRYFCAVRGTPRGASLPRPFRS